MSVQSVSWPTAAMRKSPWRLHRARNSRAFYEVTAGEMERAFGLEPMTLVSVEVSGLQWVNDRLGYAAGDRML